MFWNNDDEANYDYKRLRRERLFPVVLALWK